MRFGILAMALAVGLAAPVLAGDTPSNPDARVYITNLSDGDTVSGPVTVRFGLVGMGIAPAGVEWDNTGHHHLIVDRAPYGAEAGDNGLKRHGLSEDRIKFELFKSDQPGRLPQRVLERREAGAALVPVQLTLDGTRRSFDLTPGQTVLEAALANGIEAPFACKAGVCSTCRCKVIGGEVEMATNHALEDYEDARGIDLSCQSHPVSDRLVVDYDH